MMSNPKIDDAAPAAPVVTALSPPIAVVVATRLVSAVIGGNGDLI